VVTETQPPAAETKPEPAKIQKPTLEARDAKPTVASVTQKFSALVSK